MKVLIQLIVATLWMELIKLLSKYHAPLRSHLDKINSKGTHNRITFMSNTFQNVLLKIISDIVRTKILYDVQKSGQFSVIIDTTTDVSNLKQFKFILFIDLILTIF